jgi:repressor LexA
MTAHTGLTHRQQQVLDFIARGFDHGCPPTLQEIADHFDLGITTVQDHVAALAAKGALERGGGKARGFRVVGRPEPGSQVRLPVLGRVPAGFPVEAIEHAEDNLVLDKSLAQGADFILRVHGDSMAPDILDGDRVLVKRCPLAENGQTVIAHVGDDAATVKRLRREGREAWLEPTNPAYKPIRGKPFKVVGRVLGLVRTYGRGRA